MKQTLAIVAAGIVTFLTAATLEHLANDPAYGSQSILRSNGVIQAIVVIVFFGILLLFGRWAFNSKEEENPPQKANQDSFKVQATPQETAAEMARLFAGVTDDASRRRAIRGWLLAVPEVTVLIPFVFYVRFGAIGPLGWGLTVFFDVYCLLWAFGLYFLPRTEYHSPVRLRGDWLDRVGAFWLVSCALGPLLGWLVTEAFPITEQSWRWLYGLRVFLAAGIPILLALPMLRYMRGKSARVALPLAVALTMLPVSTAVHVGQDLWEGPVVRNGTELYLQHTERMLLKK